MPELRVESGVQKGQTFLLGPPGPYRFGRDLQADFPLFDRLASRRHFRLDFRDEGYLLTDLESRRGTQVNGASRKTAFLQHGDAILVGRTLLRFALEHAGDPLEGKELGGFRLLEKVGAGSMGAVYRALQKSLDRIVAVKVLSPNAAVDGEFCALFIREARAAAELSHPNIVRVYDVNLLQGHLFYAMEFMAGGTVLDSLRRRGPLPLESAVEIAAGAAAALDYAGRLGLVHRDIKPANLLLQGTGAVKLGDLGIAVFPGRMDDEAAAGTICGSPLYMAPEQALGRAVDARADAYALGATLHHMLAGAPPFGGENLKAIVRAKLESAPPRVDALRADVPASLADLVAEMLARDPARRPAAAVARERLEAIAARGSLPEPREPAGEQARRRRWMWIVLAFVFGGALGFVVGFLLTAAGAEGNEVLR